MPVTCDCIYAIACGVDACKNATIKRTNSPISARVSKNACTSSYAYQSIVANGTVRFMYDEEETTKILSLICLKYFGSPLPMAKKGVLNDEMNTIILQNPYKMGYQDVTIANWLLSSEEVARKQLENKLNSFISLRSTYKKGTTISMSTRDIQHQVKYFYLRCSHRTRLQLKWGKELPIKVPNIQTAKIRKRIPSHG